MNVDQTLDEHKTGCTNLGNKWFDSQFEWRKLIQSQKLV